MKNLKTKIIAVFLLVSLGCVFFPKPTSAGWWGEPSMAVQYQITVEKMLKSIEDTLVANLKIAAIRIINGRLSVLLTGSAGQYGGGGGAVIGNWQDFVYGSAQRYALSATNDFFMQIRSGIPNTLASRIVGPAQKAVETSICDIQPDAQNYIPNGDATKIFTSGASNPWMRWRMMAMPQNDLASIYLCGEGRKQAAYNQQAELQKAQAIAGQGYKSVTASNGKQVTVPPGSDYAGKDREVTTSSGAKVSAPASSSYAGSPTITTPASSVKSTVERIFQLPMAMLENAKSIPEVVTSMVNSMISQVIQQGVNKMTAPIDEQIIKARNQAGQSLGQMQSAVQSGIVNATTPSNRSGNNQYFGR